MLAFLAACGSNGGSGEEPTPEPDPDPVVEPDPDPDPEPDPEPDPDPDPDPVPDDSGFSFLPAGQLLAGSGTGFADNTNYRPGMRFPILQPDAYLNSQLYRNGGGRESSANPVIGVDADGNPQFEFNQCDVTNYSYPWQDNFCENRSWSNKFCAGDVGHEGVDIRGASCRSSAQLDADGQSDVNVVVAAEDGTVIDSAPHLIKIESTDATTFYVYLHMDQRLVDFGDTVVRGQPIGRIANLDRYGNSNTTRHLHFEIQQNFELDGTTFVRSLPPYSTLIDAYQRLLAGTP